MKIGVVGDIHWSKYSSIIRSRGEKYSTRLENCISSVNWAEQLFIDNDCDIVVYLGDFFDSCDLKSEELTALTEINWSKFPHYFLVGNHEMGMHDLSFSSGHVFSLCDNLEVIDIPSLISYSDTNIYFLPYILESERKAFSEYVGIDNAIVFSHNDLKGVQLGNFISQVGFDLNEIEENCSLFINGHLHNGYNVSSKIINLGNLTGQNFSEDATKYQHRVMILDTDTLKYDYFINPFAFNFFKFDLTTDLSYDTMKTILSNSANAVFTVKTFVSSKLDFKNFPNVIASRVIIQPEINHNNSNDKAYESLSINHLEKFKEYVLSEFGNSDIVLEELSAVIQ